MKRGHQNSEKRPAVSSLQGNDNKSRRKRSKRKTAPEPTAGATPIALISTQTAHMSEWRVLEMDDDLRKQDLAAMARILAKVGIDLRLRYRPMKEGAVSRGRERGAATVASDDADEVK